jgi:hypothetical protein
MPLFNVTVVPLSVAVTLGPVPVPPPGMFPKERKLGRMIIIDITTHNKYIFFIYKNFEIA